MSPTDLLNVGLPQTFNLFKKKKGKKERKHSICETPQNEVGLLQNLRSILQEKRNSA